ncbi:hypothetical protein GCM10018980_51610 [Streptomyces capoamus]|uniref:Uncharacterized protein n=1 Tax=Streptomyces capoamus TaxID=68183 RepID=A0A919KE32_9ACTN|nr:hypothetical protein [Streptomyces capoamus]GGW15777.1 hypothetical protein GCM10010501_29200 [Streptomyces libani subsp. rufus]GHG62019.1 hypothetical protein GCM10018980_51610 [Streptomyces capoamus]
MTAPGPDERRTRHYLRRLGARPLGHQEPTVSIPEPRRPVTPTRVIPAGAPLPARPPEPGEAPPWRTPPPPPPVATPPAPPAPPPQQPAEMVVRHVHEMLPVVEERPPRLWERLWDTLVTWRMLVAILAALIPWAGGRSPVGIWAHTVHQARAEASIGAAYVIAAVAIAAAWGLDRHTGRALPRFLLVTALLGSLGVLDWVDALTLLTGVHR